MPKMPMGKRVREMMQTEEGRKKLLDHIDEKEVTMNGKDIFKEMQQLAEKSRKESERYHRLDRLASACIGLTLGLGLILLEVLVN